MKQFSQDELLEILKRHERKLKSLEGVTYVDVGYKFKDGELKKNELAIRVHVRKKIKSESDVDPSQLISPDMVEGAPIDVIQSNPEKQQDRQQRFNPLVGGVLVWNTHLSAFAGTLGAVVFDADDTSKHMALSNYHVFFGIDGTGTRGDYIAQPDTVDGNDVIGTLARGNKGLDCAVCTLNNGREISRRIEGYPDRPGGPDRPTGVMQPSLGMRVTKSGVTTGVTYGIVDGVSLKEFTVIPDPDHPSPTGEISAGGDSGSVWLEVKSFKAVGLHWAGERDPDPRAERAWAKQMDKVAKKLKIVFESESTGKDA